MSEHYSTAKSTDRFRTSPHRTERANTPSAGEAAVRRPSPYDRFDVDRPPHWLVLLLVLAAMADGLLAFSSVWTSLGDLVVAAPFAAVVGVGVGSGTVLAGLLVWTRVIDETSGR